MLLLHFQHTYWQLLVMDSEAWRAAVHGVGHD